MQIENLKASTIKHSTV